MIRLSAIAPVLLIGCGQTTSPVSGTSASLGEARYFACMETKGLAQAKREHLTEAQAKTVAQQCHALLRTAAAEILSQRLKGVDMTKLNPTGRGVMTIGFLEAHIENQGMRRISAAVLALPEV